jgi:glyoxylase-like metal-dependent hydrolase (beta-lactamase superfamily II)
MIIMNADTFADDIFIVGKDMRPGWYYSVLVLFGKDRIGVIDTGFENTLEDLVLPLIKGKGRDPSEINLVVNTHRDGDHVKGNKSFKDNTGATIMAHHLEAEAITLVDKTFKEDDFLHIGDRSFKVIHTPGHRPGAVCLLDEANKLLITADSVCGTREDLIRMGKEVYIKSLKGLLDLDVEHMIMSHPFQPAGKNILEGSEISEMIKASIEIAEKL